MLPDAILPEFAVEIRRTFAFETAQRGCKALCGYIRKEEICFIPAILFTNNKLVFLSDNLDSPIVIKPLPFGRKRDIDVYIRVQITQISPDIDRYGKPFVRVDCRLIDDQSIYAVHRKGNPYIEQAYYWEGRHDDRLLYIYHWIPTPSDIQELTLAPETIFVSRQILTMFDQKLEVKYYIQ